MDADASGILHDATGCLTVQQRADRGIYRLEITTVTSAGDQDPRYTLTPCSSQRRQYRHPPQIRCERGPQLHTDVKGRLEVGKNVYRSTSCCPSALSYTKSKIETSSSRDELRGIYVVVFHNLQLRSFWPFPVFVVWGNMYPNIQKVILELF